MSKEMGVIALGVFMIVQPYLGIPNSWHTFLTVVAGLAITILGFFLRSEALAGGHRISSRNSFVENSTTTIVQDYSTNEQA